MVIGDKLSAGATLYVDLWDDIAPLSAAVFWLIDELFGRSNLAYQVFGILLIITQSAIFNTIMLKHKVYNENTYAPAFIYAILMSLFFDFFSITPILLGLTFILLGTNLLFTHIQSWQKRDDRILTLGVYIGISCMFYFPFFTYIAIAFFAFIFFTGTSLRRNFLFLYGFIIPFILIWLYYYWYDGAQNFLINFIYSVFMFRANYFVSIPSILIIAAIPGLYLIPALFKTFSVPGFTNFQVRIQQIMFLMLITGLLSFMLSNEKAPFHLAIFVPSAAFFLTHYFLLIRKKIWLELSFIVFFILILFVNLGTYYDFFITSRWINDEALLVKETKWNDLVEGKKILYLGQDVNIYQNAGLATPYLNWRLTRLHFDNLEYYDNLTNIMKNFRQDSPEIIIDPNQVMPEVFNKIPALDKIYIRSDQFPEVYLLTNSKALN